jgi:hypothetical protein
MLSPSSQYSIVPDCQCQRQHWLPRCASALHIGYDLAHQFYSCAYSQNEDEEQCAQPAQIGRMDDMVRSIARVVAWRLVVVCLF